MRQANALTILVPSAGLRLVRWNNALPKLIRISTSIAITRYLNNGGSSMWNGAQAVYRVNQSWFPHLLAHDFHDAVDRGSDRIAEFAGPLAVAPRRRKTRVV